MEWQGRLGRGAPSLHVSFSQRASDVASVPIRRLEWVAEPACEHWFGRVGIHSDTNPAPLAFCKRWDVFWSWLPVVAGIVFMYENVRQTFCRCREYCRHPRQHGLYMILLLLLVFGTSIHPIYYNHYMLFMYINDHWYPLLSIQMFFTLTDNLCLMLRFCDALPELRAVIHGYHLAFGIFREENPLKYIGFLIDDAAELAYACLYRPVGCADQPHAYMSVASTSEPDRDVIGKKCDDHQQPQARTLDDFSSMVTMRRWVIGASVPIVGAIAFFSVVTAHRVT